METGLWNNFFLANNHIWHPIELKKKGVIPHIRAANVSGKIQSLLLIHGAGRARHYLPVFGVASDLLKSVAPATRVPIELDSFSSHNDFM